jgi:hypothetical protein
LGAVAAGADTRLQQMWRRYGTNIGQAYQIADDLHEIEHALHSRSVSAGGLTDVAPALLFYAAEIRPYLSEALRRETASLEGEFLEQFIAAAALMRAEKERRVSSAVAEIAGDLPDCDRNRLVSQAPGDIIRMFDEAASVR